MKNKTKFLLTFILTVAMLLCSALGLIGCAGGNTEPETKIEFSVITKEVNINVGEQFELKYTYKGTETISFTSSNTSVVTVAENGIVFGVAKGVAFISVAVDDCVEVCKINVDDVVYSMRLGMNNTTILLGSDYKFEATLFKNGAETSGQISWAVNADSLEDYTLNVLGNTATFTPKKIGDFVISASSDKATASCFVKVVSENALRADLPTLSIDKCNKIVWNTVLGATSYDIMVNYTQWVNVTETEFDITNYVTTSLLKDGESIDVFVKAKTDGNYDFVDSGISKIIVSHNYAKNETVVASCVKVGTMEYTCNDCGVSYTDNNYYRPHVYESAICTVCNEYQTSGIAYVFDDNYIPLPSYEEGADENSAWRKKYADYYDLDRLSESEKGAAINRYLWIQVQSNRDDIPVEEREVCYYAAGVTDNMLEEAYVAGYYDDGTHGRHPVKYLFRTFKDNDTIRKVVLSKETTELRGQAFLWCDSIETIIMPGVTYVTTVPNNETFIGDNFNSCYQLKELVVADGFVKQSRQFFAQLYTDSKKTGYQQQMEIFVLGDGSKPIKVETQLHEAEFEGSIYTGNVYYQHKPETEADIRCETWDFVDGKVVKIRHHLFENKECIYCGAYQDYNVKYGYDRENDCYYVKDGSKITKSKIKILAEYNDGLNGVKPVKYIGDGAFKENLTLTHIYIPESVDTIKGNAFSLCKNLQYVDMIGVSELGKSASEINAFLACNNLTTLIINKDLKVSHQTFVKGSHSTPLGMNIYARYQGGEIKMHANDTIWLYGGERYVFDVDISNCKSWRWNESKTDIVFNNTNHILDKDGKCTINGCIGYDETLYPIYGYDVNQDCYYVANNPKLTASKIAVASTYNDGEHGEKHVKYIASNAFAGNENLTHVYLPDTVTQIKDSAFSNCKNLVEIDLGGVTKLGRDENNVAMSNAFLACNSLKVVIINKDLNVTHQTFVKGSWSDNIEGFELGFSVYAKNSGGTINIPTGVLGNDNTIWTNNSKIYIFSEIDCLNTWKYDENNNIEISTVKAHSYIDGVCVNCGTIQTQGVVYTLSDDQTYYSVTGYTGTDAKVYVRANINNIPITTIGVSAFAENQTITHIYLPNSVTVIKASAFQLCCLMPPLPSAPTKPVRTNAKDGKNLPMQPSASWLKKKNILSLSFGELTHRRKELLLTGTSTLY